MDELRDTQYNLPIGTDLISRKQAIDAIRNRWLKTMNYEGIGEDIAEECEICLRTVPSAQPRGKWIYNIDDLFPAESTKECDQCHAEQPLICDDEFCPHCGAKMEVTE